MTIVLFDPEWVIERLKLEVPSLKFIGGAAELVVAEVDLKQTPSAYVFEVGDSASENTTGTMTTSQNNAVTFAVAFAVKNLRDPRGQNAKSDLRGMRTAIFDALHGWRPHADFDPIQKRTGCLVKMRKTVLWWKDEFLTAHLIRS